MKKLYVSLVATASFFSAHTAMADDGIITFTGEISGQSCTINSGNANINVVLPTVSTTALKQIGDVAGRTPFSISLTDCSTPAGGVHAFFEKGPSVDASTGRLNLEAGGATGLQIILQNDDYTDIKVGFADGSQNSKSVQLSGGAATLNYNAAYYATGTVSPGTVNSNVTYSVIYE